MRLGSSLADPTGAGSSSRPPVALDLGPRSLSEWVLLHT